VEEYLRIKSVGLQETTLLTYTISLKQLVKYLGLNHGGVLSVESYTAFVEHLLRRVKTGTARKIRDHCSAFLKYCEHCGYIRCSPDRVVPRIKPPYRNSIRRFITLEEYQQIRTEAEGTIYEWALICAYYTAMSMVDICKLRWENVDMEQLVVHRVRQKSGRKCTIPFFSGDDMHKALLFLWDEHLEVENHCYGSALLSYVSPSLFVGYQASQSKVSMDLKVIIKRVRPDCSFHDFRHTGATALANSGVPFTLAGQVTGHSNINMFARYIRPDIQALRGAVMQARKWQPL